MVGDTLFVEVAAVLAIPVVGLLLLIFGIRWYRWRQRSPAQQYRPPPPTVPPGWYPPPPAPRPEKIGGAIAMIIVGSVLLVLGSGVAVVTALGGPDLTPGAAQRSPVTAPEALQVGQCITDQQYASAEMTPEPADCAGRDAVYELAYQAEGPGATCPDGLREDSGYAVLFNSAHTFCFVLNVDEGECFSVDPGAQLFSPVECTDPTANSRIDRIFDGAEDLSLCPAGPQGATFPLPARTYCLTPPQ